MENERLSQNLKYINTKWPKIYRDMGVGQMWAATIVVVKMNETVNTTASCIHGLQSG